MTALVVPSIDLYDSWAACVAEFGGAHLDGASIPDEEAADVSREACERLVAKTARDLSAVADELDATVAENREPLRDFSNSGLYELTQLMNELRTLVSSMTRISGQIERDPARFFLGDRREGFQAE